jgi:hypothetical protein
MNNQRQPARLFSAMLLGLFATSASAAGERAPIISEGGTSSFWSPAPGPKVMPGYPSNAADPSEDACVSVGYMLNKDGTTSEFTLLKSWGAKTPDSIKGRAKLTPYAQLAIAAVQRWKFVPAQAEHAEIKPVYTAASFAFSNDPAANKEQLREHCVIGDLPAFIAQAQAEAYKRGNLKKGMQERARIMNPATITGTANGGVR